MQNKHQTDAYEADPHGFYREPPWLPGRIFDLIDFGNDVIYDPFCGTGNILDEAKRRGHPTIGSDIVDRSPRHAFRRGNFMMATKFPVSHDRPLSIFCNPPFNTPPGSAANAIIKTIEQVPFRRAAFVVPIEFACGQDRYRDIYAKHKPSHVIFCSERPSMPPGTEVEGLGDNAFRGGKSDFVVIVWTAGGPWRTECLWTVPRDLDRKPKSLGRKPRN